MSESGDDSLEGRVLLLPATRRDGEAIRMFLRRESIDCMVCASASHMAEEIGRGAAALVLTDMALADASGRAIIETLLQQPQWSDMPVVLLGNQVNAVETERLTRRMTNVTLLERPSSSRTLLSAIRTSLRARHRQYELRDQIAALRKAQIELRDNDRRKDEFLAMLAHELRNPLAPIRAASDLLPRIVPPGDERVDATLKVVKRQVGQLSRLVNDLLDVSRITQGRIELQREVVDLASIVVQAAESIQPLMQEKRQRLLSEMPDSPLHVCGDRARLVQCVSNLLSNSAKYSDTGGVIQISLRHEDDFAVLCVQDNGIGMPPELLPRIFDLFVQSERSLDRSEGGLGIGLSVVKQLIQMHNGRVAARSAGLGQGSTLEIRLPVVPAPSEGSVSVAPLQASGRRVLIVDDNRDAADAISMLLEIHGHEVRTAYAGEEALQIAAAFPAELVLLDIGLPDMNGYEVARRLREAGTDSRLVALTGYGQPDDVRRSRAAGFDAHLVKPVEIDQLLEALNG